MWDFPSIVTKRGGRNFGSIHSHISMIVRLLADNTVDLEADPLLHLLMKYKQENKTAVAKIDLYGAYGGSGNYLLKEPPKLEAQQKTIAVTVPIMPHI